VRISGNRFVLRMSFSLYDRGHNAPDKAIAVCYGQQAVDETYLMSNMLPESPNLNRHVWMQLERKEIDEYARTFGEIWVITGGVFGQNAKRLPDGVEIPDACYRIIVDEDQGKPRVLAFVIPQNVAPTDDAAKYLTSVDQVERETGLDFMSELPDDVENKLEAEKAGMW